MEGTGNATSSRKSTATAPTRGPSVARRRLGEVQRMANGGRAAPRPLSAGCACPRCDRPLERATSSLGLGVAPQLLVGALSAPRCPSCGPIPLSELPAEARQRYVVGSLVFALLAIALIAVVVVIRLAVH